MTCKIECVRCQQLLPCSAKLPLLCSCGHRHVDQAELRQVDAARGLPAKIVGVTTAYTKWRLAGAPVRSDEEVKAIRAICRACPLFQRDGTCGLCGCDVGRKALWATEHCPLVKSKW